MERENEPITPPQGSSEVHSELSVNPSKGEGMSGRFEAEGAGAGTVDRARARVGQTRDEITGRAGEMKDRVADARTGISNRAAELTGRARSKVDEVRADAERLTTGMQERASRAMNDSGARRRIDQYPLAAFSLAFGTGFLLAGSGGNKSGRTSRAKHQIRGALMSAATAAIAREARSMLGMESGQSGGLGDLLGGSSRRRTRAPQQPRSTGSARPAASA